MFSAQLSELRLELHVYCSSVLLPTQIVRVRQQSRYPLHKLLEHAPGWRPELQNHVGKAGHLYERGGSLFS